MRSRPCSRNRSPNWRLLPRGLVDQPGSTMLLSSMYPASPSGPSSHPSLEFLNGAPDRARRLDVRQPGRPVADRHRQQHADHLPPVASQPQPGSPHPGDEWRPALTQQAAAIAASSGRFPSTEGVSDVVACSVWRIATPPAPRHPQLRRPPSLCHPRHAHRPRRSGPRHADGAVSTGRGGRWFAPAPRPAATRLRPR